MIELLDNSVSNLKNNELAHIKKLAENNQSIDKNMEGNIVLSIRPFFLLNGDLVVPVSVTKTIFPSLLKRRFSSGFELKLDGVLIDYTVSKKWLFGNNNS